MLIPSWGQDGHLWNAGKSINAFLLPVFQQWGFKKDDFFGIIKQQSRERNLLKLLVNIVLNGSHRVSTSAELEGFRSYYFEEGFLVGHLSLRHLCVFLLLIVCLALIPSVLRNFMPDIKKEYKMNKQWIQLTKFSFQVNGNG